jgi:hypothetical protein
MYATWWSLEGHLLLIDLIQNRPAKTQFPAKKKEREMTKMWVTANDAENKTQTIAIFCPNFFLSFRSAPSPNISVPYCYSHIGAIQPAIYLFMEIC